MSQYIKIRQTKADKEFKFSYNQRISLRALRSGNFKQGVGGGFLEESVGRSYKGISYCCLGVMNHVCRLEESCDWSLESTFLKMGLHRKDGEFVKDNEDFKVYWEDPDSNIVYEYASLAEMNDGKYNNYKEPVVGKWSFEEIADFIETYPTLVFSKGATNV
jgi:hypothetical protein